MTTMGAAAEPHQPIPLPRADSSLPFPSPTKTVYEPVGGYAIRLGESNPLYPNAKEDHQGEEVGRENRDHGRRHSRLGGKDHARNGHSRDESVTRSHCTTASMRERAGSQDVSETVLSFSLLFSLLRAETLLSISSSFNYDRSTRTIIMTSTKTAFHLTTTPSLPISPTFAEPQLPR